jgi:ADP-ribosylglycohydrolase/ADP-ribose pyrophosphatase YjhB (NUDIX family)
MPTYRYARPAVASDIIVLDREPTPTRILLIERKNDPFAGQWAFPGGFVDEGEDPLHAAARELREETGVADLPLRPFRFYGHPDRDPRGHCISCTFTTHADPATIAPLAADDAAAVKWFPLADLPALAFDHATILRDFLTKSNNYSPMPASKPTREAFRGSLLGMALGDALGTTLEFRPPGTFKPLTDLVGGGPFDLKAGQWTDDTSMALCLAESLLACDGMDLSDQADRYLRWWQFGENSVLDHCFDIGNTVSAALRHYKATGDARAGSFDPQSAGNGSLMRLAPVPLYYSDRPIAELLEMSELSSRTTHQAPQCLWSCRAFALYLRQALTATSKAEALHTPEALFEAGPETPLLPQDDPLRDVFAGSYRERNPPEIRGSGYVIEALEAALWAFSHSKNFRHGCLLAANLGNDADTTAAIYGQIAGAYYRDLPADWLAKLAWRDKITQLADKLFANL